MDDIFNMDPEPTPEEIAQKKANQQKMAAKKPKSAPMPITEGENASEPLLEDYNPLDNDDHELPYIPFGKQNGNGSPSYSQNRGGTPGADNTAPSRFDPNMIFKKGNPLAKAVTQNKGKMNDLMGTFDKMGVNTINAGGKEVNPNSSNVLDNVKENFTYTVENLENPENWLPKGKENLAPKLKAISEKYGLVKALKSLIAFIEKCE